MLLHDRKYSELYFHEVFSGGICLLHRPSKGGIKILSENRCTAVVSLLSPTENPHEIGNTCKSLGMTWLWVPLQGANKRLLESNNASWLLRRALLDAKDLILKGNFILIHCAAGIHRTGLFTYALLRVLGLDKPQTLDTIQKIRNVTYEKCGIHRFELAESLATQLLSESMSQEIGVFQQLEAVKFIAVPLVWMRFTMTHEQSIRFECIVTDKEVKKYVLGPNLNLSIDYNYLMKMLGSDWMGAKQAKYLPGGITKNFKFAEREILQFCTETFPSNVGVVIGRNCFLENRFLCTFWTTVEGYLSSVVMDISCFEEFQETNTDFEHLYQEILAFKALSDRLGHFPGEDLTTGNPGDT